VDSWNEWIWLLQFLIAFLCPHCREQGFKRYCNPSVPAAVGYRHAGCLQLSHVRTEDLSADGCRSAASQTANVGSISRCRLDDNLLLTVVLWYSEPLLTLLICGCLSHYIAVSVPVACWAVFWFHMKWIQNWTESETNTPLFIHTSYMYLWSHIICTLDNGMRSSATYYVLMSYAKFSSLDIYHVSCCDFLCWSVTV